MLSENKCFFRLIYSLSLRYIIVAASLYIPETLAATSTVNVSVTVIDEPACVVNGNQTIVVNFGNDMFTHKVDGNNYLEGINYTLECKNSRLNTMRMQITGNTGTFKNKALQTSQPDLGIELRADGRTLPVNSWLNFTYPDIPKLQAIPVKNAGATLTGGEFSATATLLVDYQ